MQVEAGRWLRPEDVERIVAMEDPLARNSAITHGYHRLSEAGAHVLGREHANWLTFGQWASAEARRSITGAAVPRRLRDLFADGVAAAVADGNAAVFGDVAPPFIRFLDVLARRGAAASSNTGLEHVRAELRDDPGIAASADLQRAFGAYLDAVELRRAMDAAGDREAEARRAQRTLVANVSIGAHEQVVADPFVKAAIPGRSLLAIIATSHMVLRLPDVTLELDEDVPRPDYLQGHRFPATLRELTDPELLALAERFGQDPRTTADSDAPNWESYHERMGFIFALLRVYQCDARLFALPPGTPASAS